MFNNKNSLIKIFIALLLLNISLIFNMNYTHADSGFDSSYDSGGSYSSSYDYSSSSSYDYSSSSSSSSYSSGGYSGSANFTGFWYILASAVVVAIINYFMKKRDIGARANYITIIIILLFTAGNIIYGPDFFVAVIALGYAGFMMIGFPLLIINSVNKNNHHHIKTNDYFAHNAKFDVMNTKELQDKLFNVYKDIQLAWAKNDIKAVRNILSDELYNTYQMQIDSMIATNQRNEMSDIKFIKMVVGNDMIANNFEEIKVIMQVTCRDYIVENKNGKEKVIRGKESIINDYIYAMTFVRNIKVKKPECPNCGAKLDNAMSSICPSCNSVVIHDTDNWVLTKKQMLRQTRR